METIIPAEIFWPIVHRHSHLPARTVTRYLECAGNGRSFYQTLLNRPAQGGQWRLGAYGINLGIAARPKNFQCNAKSGGALVIGCAKGEAGLTNPK